MGAFIDAAKSAAKDAICFTLGNAQRFLDFTDSLYPLQDIPNPVRGIRQALCDAPDPPLPDPPFSGGQCNAIYRVRTVRSNSPPGTFTAPSVEIAGPIVNIVYSPNPVQIGDTGSAIPTTLTVTNAAGASVSDTALVSGAPNESVGLTPDIRLRSGAPDNCGDPDPRPNPWPTGGVPVPVPVTYVNNEGDEITNEGDLNIFAPVFAPITGSFNNIRIPFSLDFPDLNLNLNGTLDFGPDINIQLFPNSEGQNSPGSEGQEPPNVDPDTDPEPPENGDSRRLIGAIIRCQLNNQRATEIAQDEGPVLFVPRLANVWFRVRQGRSSSWLGPYDVKATNVYVPVPPDVNATGVRVSGEFGVDATATPVFSDSIRDD